MRNISLFCSEKGAGQIRAYQIAPLLNARINPTEGYEDDICIYVKKEPPINHPRHSYLDIVDARERILWLLRNPNIGVIASSDVAQMFLSKRLNRKDILLIPQQHCNFERFKRDRKEIKVAGFIGVPNSMVWPLEEVEKKLKDIGVELKINTTYKKREDVVNFYKQIDIQILFRTCYTVINKRVSEGLLRTCLKLQNASSFGIPTVSFPEPGYVEEYEGLFIEAYSLDSLIDGVKALKESKELYNSYVTKGLEKAEQYHIDNIIKLYKKLK